MAPGPDLRRVSCGHTVVSGSGLRGDPDVPALGDCGAPSLWSWKEVEGVRPFLLLGGSLRTLGCSINTQDSYQGPDEFLKTVIGWTKLSIIYLSRDVY